MAGLDVLIKAVAAFYLAGAAALLLRGSGRKAPLLFLSVFLLLLAANQAAEVLRSAARDAGSAMAPLWFRVGTVFAALDPFVMLYVGLIFPERRVARWWPALVVAGALSAFFAFSAATVDVFWLYSREAGWFYLAWATYTVGVYALVFSFVRRDLMLERAHGPATAMFPALAILTVPAWNRVLDMVAELLATGFGPFGSPDPDHLGLLGLPWLIVPLGALVMARLWMRRLDDDQGAQRRALWGGVVVAVLLTLALMLWRVYRGFASLPETAGWVAALDPGVLDTLVSRGGNALRLILFGGLVAAAAARGRLMPLSGASQGKPVQDLVALAFIPVGVGLVFLMFGWIPDVYILVVLLLGCMLFIGDWLPRLGGAVWQAASASGGWPSSTPGVSAALSPGDEVLRRYRIGRQLGDGSQGRTFEASDPLLARQVVIKERWAGAGRAAAVMLEEARAQAAVSHPGVVRVHDAQLEGGRLLLVCDPVEGVTLGEWIERSSPGPAGRLRVLSEIVEALAGIHAAGVSHGDIKPANVLIDRGGRVQITDFGSAMRERATVRLDGDFPLSGTLAFLAPERRRGGPPSPAADVYAFGVLARDVIGEQASREVAALVALCLDPDVGRRPMDGSALRAAWRDAVGPRMRRPRARAAKNGRR